MKYFDISELCVSATHPNLVKLPEKGSQIEKNMQNLIEKLLDPVREKIGKPITVTSGYRPQALNTAVHGENSSNHLFGQAADCHTGNNNSDNLLMVNALMELNIQFDECIIEGAKFNAKGEITGCQWVHLALRQTGNRRKFIWTSDMKTYHPVKAVKSTTYTYSK